jgi:acid phosphatase type 7
MDKLVRTSQLVFKPLQSIVLPVVVALLTACGDQSTNPTGPTNPSSGSGGSTSPATPNPSGAPPVVLVGAGDIAMCDSNLTNAFATASLLGAIDGRIFTAGDNTQNTGSMDEFVNCFGPSWGRYRSRISPSPGNHDYQTASGAAYYSYFGAAAGPAGLGYYSYTWGAWHVISLNSNVSMKPGSAQANWMRADLEESEAECTLAYWHHPLFTSGPNGNNTAVRDAWTILYEHGAELVLNGHDHIYERFAPQDPSGRLDLARGIRQFTVGTGGAYLTKVERLQANSEVQGIGWGVLRLTLREAGYDWEFVPVPGGRFLDAGSASCH